MIRIALVGSIGSGKSYISKLFNFPIFNADQEVNIIYKKDKKTFLKLKKALPKFFFNFPTFISISIFNFKVIDIKFF